MTFHSFLRATVFVLWLSVPGCAEIFAQEAKPEPSQIDDRSASLLPAQTPASQTTPQQSYVPLSARQKLAFGARKAFVDPAAYLGPVFDAYFTERREVKAPGKTGGDKFADGLSRYARSFATNTTAAMFGSGFYPALFKQDPRYHPSEKHGFVPRALYAASRTVLTLGDNGKTQINFSGLGGNLTSAGLANIYERDLVKARDVHGRPIAFRRRIGVRPTLANFGISTAFDAVTNIVFKEFDVVGRLIKLIKD